MASSLPPNSRNQSPSAFVKQQRADHGPVLITALMMLGVAWIITQWMPSQGEYDPSTFQATWATKPAPLEMNGGDPYIRALMRTISASESNTTAPYHVIYGGQHIKDLSRHPEICVDIVAGPNVGNCSTAAGRYQFLDKTWLDKAERYHPRQPNWIGLWKTYSFEPEFQDRVVYRWLTDVNAWGGVDISARLQQGEVEQVFKMLSGTWTSLGYGIEDNTVTPYLAQIYQEMLNEELGRVTP